MADPDPRKHRVSIEINGREIPGWLEYQIDTSLVEESDSFTMVRPFSRDAYDLLERDSFVRVLVDGQTRMSGFLGKRRKGAKNATIEISGRDRLGRLIDESAPRSAYGGTTMLAVLNALAQPWFPKGVTLSNARNRRAQLGKGSKAPADDESIALGRARGKPKKKISTSGPITALLRATATERFDPGMMRMAMIKRIASRAGLAVWSSADGLELFVGQPDQKQEATFLFCHSKRRRSTVKDLTIEDNNEGRYSMITALGGGVSGDRDYGDTSHAGTVLDNPYNTKGVFSAAPDGTGLDFKFPKRLVLAEQSARTAAEAERLARLEQQKRDFSRLVANAQLAYHGQVVQGTSRTLFALDTVARVIDDDIDFDVDMIIYSANFRASWNGGEETELQLVPRGTDFIV